MGISCGDAIGKEKIILPQILVGDSTLHKGSPLKSYNILELVEVVGRWVQRHSEHMMDLLH